MFNEKQKRRVELLAKCYLAAYLLPVLLHIVSSEFDIIVGFVLWPLSSFTYFLLYRQVILELPPSDRFILTWGVSTYLPQIFYKASLFFLVFFAYIWGATLWENYI